MFCAYIFCIFVTITWPTFALYDNFKIYICAIRAKTYWPEMVGM